MCNTIIKVENLSKRYRLGIKENKANTLVGQLKQVITSPYHNYKRLLKLNKFANADESIYWALKDVNFEVKEGEVLGIIGKNGAGKSTLLKILSQITVPTSGRVEMYGRVASLLEVGTGFHPELTGRDNIYMNGTILGMTKKEIDSKLDEIVEFSGVEKFIDTPVKFYSSGMKVRLGFSVAAHLDPEILIIDEVLAVGDYEFQKKCLGKMEDVSKNQGRTVIFVSHNLAAVKALCNHCILLDLGHLLKSGNTDEIIGEYIKSSFINNIKAIENIKICDELFIIKAQIFPEVNILKYDQEIILKFLIKYIRDSSFYINLIVRHISGEVVFECPSQKIDKNGIFSITYTFPINLFNTDVFSIQLNFNNMDLSLIGYVPNILSFETQGKPLFPNYFGYRAGYLTPEINISVE